MNASDLKRLSTDLGAAAQKAREAIAEEDAPRLKAELVRLSVAASQAALEAAQKAAKNALCPPRRHDRGLSWGRLRFLR
jgi:hypothetical protein